MPKHFIKKAVAQSQSAHGRAVAEPVRPNPGEPPPEAIAAYAYYIWEQEGRPVGRDQEHWLQAAAQFRWALLNCGPDDLASPSQVRRTLWEHLTARFGPGR